MSVRVAESPHDPGGGSGCGDFSEAAGPRPPAIGKEPELQSSSPPFEGGLTRSKGYPSPSDFMKGLTSANQAKFSFNVGHMAYSAPATALMTPRRSIHHSGTVSPPGCDATAYSTSDYGARCRDGNADGTDVPSSSPPCMEPIGSIPCLRWAESLQHLLDDSDGVDLFRHYLQQERCADHLDFYYACVGFKQVPPECTEKIEKLIGLIYRKYLRARSVINFSPKTWQQISEKINTKTGLSQHIFDDAQHEVECLIAQTTYPNFLKSEIYLQYLHAVQNGLGDSESPKMGCETSASSSSELSEVGVLSTVPEDCEMPIVSAGCGSGISSDDPLPATLPLTSKHLLVTQERRARYRGIRRPEAYAGHYLQHSPSLHAPNPYHAMYASYVPASAQDSELQSLSSGAHTDETVSQTDSSVDGVPANNRKKYLRQQNRAIHQNARQNKDVLAQQPFIPRTLRLPKEPLASPSDPDEFAAILIKKLEEVKHRQESQERVTESLRKLEQLGEEKYPPVIRSEESCQRSHPFASLPPALFTAAMCEKLAPCNDSDQSILDDHVSRIWKDSPHLTPSWTPSRSRSPDGRRASAPPLSSGLFPLATSTVPASRGQHHRHRKDRESSATVDRGSLTPDVAMDFSDQYPKNPHHHYHHHGTKFSKAGIVDPVSGTHEHLFSGQPSITTLLPYECQRRSKEATRRSSSNGGTIVHEPSNQSSGLNSHERVIFWMQESEKYSGSHHQDSEKDSSTRHKKSTHSHSTLSGTSPASKRESRGKKPLAYTTSRSGSLERSNQSHSHSGGWASGVPVTLPLSVQPQPSQPFMTDPSMPILPPPNTTTQLEEARRRLEDDAKAKAAKSKSGSVPKDKFFYPETSKGGRQSLKANSAEFQDDSVAIGRKVGKKSGSSLGSQPATMAPNASSSTGPSSVAPASVGNTSEGDYTIVGYYFCGESVPYRSKLPGKNITLKHFKSLVTKKGNYRYFFKSASNEFGTGVVNEEITDDNEVLPLWEGKIFATVESVD